MDIEQHVAIVIDMADPDQRAVLVRHDAELLTQLAMQPLAHRLPRFELATGKLPQSALMDIVMAPGQQDRAVGIDQGCGGHVHETFGLARAAGRGPRAIRWFLHVIHER